MRPMRFVLVDLTVASGKANRDHAGGFGAYMNASGASGRIVTWLKSRLVNIPIMSFGFAAALLRQAGHEVVYSSGGAAEGDVFIVATSIHCHRQEMEHAQRLKQANPRSNIGYFGAFPTVRPEIFAGAGDFLVKGELEPAVLAFLRGEHQFQGPLGHGPLEDLRSLPAPDWEGLDLSRFNYFPLLRRRPIVTVQSSRGCPFACDYCSYMPMQARRHRVRDPQAVAREVARNHDRHGVRDFLFRDICFTLNRDHALSLARAIRALRLDLQWACETRIDRLDPELMDTMQEAGWSGVNLGLESPDVESLARAGKQPPPLAQQEAVLQELAARGIRVNGFFLLGLEGDTPASMRETIAYARRLNTLGAQFCILTPFPGTPLYDRLAPSLITDDFTRFNEYEPVVDIGTATPQEVAAAAREAYRYYSRAAWLRRHGWDVLQGLCVNLLLPPARGGGR